jgi:excisionase family DNA binding protein
MRSGDRFLSIAELAAIAGRSERTIRRWLKDGDLPRSKFGRAVGVWESDLLRALGRGDPDVEREADDVE